MLEQLFNTKKLKQDHYFSYQSDPPEPVTVQSSPVQCSHVYFNKLIWTFYCLPGFWVKTTTSNHGTPKVTITWPRDKRFILAVKNDRVVFEVRIIEAENLICLVQDTCVTSFSLGYLYSIVYTYTTSPICYSPHLFQLYSILYSYATYIGYTGSIPILYTLCLYYPIYSIIFKLITFLFRRLQLYFFNKPTNHPD